MTRILWHSVHPALGTGYGTQTAIWCRYLRDQGHDVAISSYFNSQAQVKEQRQDPVKYWEGIKVYPPPATGFVDSHMAQHAADWNADMIIMLADIWTRDQCFEDTKHIPTYVWMPVDCDPLSLGDSLALYKHPHIRPVAMSEHGQRVIQEFGRDADMVPHAIDTEVWKPEIYRGALRAAFGIPEGMFAIGANYNNIDPVRKATPELFYAFRDFHDKHPNSVLYAHTLAHMEKSLDQRVLAKTLGITDFVKFADQDRVHSWAKGAFTEVDMIHWYGAMDVVINASYGEGFGLPAIEAQACGTPVILSSNTTGPQLVGPGWLVQTEPFWNMTHGAWWHRPSIHGIKKALNLAYSNESPFKRAAARQFALKYDIRDVGPLWMEIIENAKHPVAA